MKKRTDRGGKRPGAGRPKIHGPRKRITLDLDPDLVAWIDANLDAPDVLALDRTHLIAGVLRVYRDEIEAHRAAREVVS